MYPCRPMEIQMKRETNSIHYRRTINRNAEFPKKHSNKTKSKKKTTNQKPKAATTKRIQNCPLKAMPKHKISIFTQLCNKQKKKEIQINNNNQKRFMY